MDIESKKFLFVAEFYEYFSLGSGSVEPNNFAERIQEAKMLRIQRIRILSTHGYSLNKETKNKQVSITDNDTFNYHFYSVVNPFLLINT